MTTRSNFVLAGLRIVFITGCEQATEVCTITLRSHGSQSLDR
jgi:hypothetical protein